MAHLEHGKAYFGRLLVRAGTKGNYTQIRKVMEKGGWLMPDGQLPSGAQGSWFYGVDNLWGKTVWPCPNGKAPDCFYSGYDVCLIPWPGKVRGCPEQEDPPAPNLNGPQYAPIPGTITLWVRTSGKNEPFEVFPPPPDDPWWEHQTWGKSRKEYERTAWFSAIWDGPTGDFELGYTDNMLETWIEDFVVHDMWDGDGNLVVGMPPAATDDTWAAPRPDLSRRSPHPTFERSGFDRGVLRPKQEATSKFPWGWVVGIGAAAVVGVAAYKMRAKTNPVGTYTLDGEPVDLTEFLHANVDGLHPDEVQEILALEPGDKWHGGGGAWAEFVVARVG